MTRGDQSEQASEPAHGRRNACSRRCRQDSIGGGGGRHPLPGGAAATEHATDLLCQLRHAPRAQCRVRHGAPTPLQMTRRSASCTPASTSARRTPSMTRHIPAAAWNTPATPSHEHHRRHAQRARREDRLERLHERGGDRERDSHAHHAPVKAHDERHQVAGHEDERETEDRARAVARHEHVHAQALERLDDPDPCEDLDHRHRRAPTGRPAPPGRSPEPRPPAPPAAAPRRSRAAGPRAPRPRRSARARPGCGRRQATSRAGAGRRCLLAGWMIVLKAIA